MKGIEERISEFEKKYADRFRKWASFVDPSDLETLIEALGGMETESKEITEELQETKSPLIETRWQPLLKNLMGLTPSIAKHLEQIRTQTRSGLDAMDKGKRSLTGYRQGVEKRRAIFDEDA